MMPAMSRSTPPAIEIDELVQLANRGRGVREFSLGATKILAGLVPFDGVSVLTMDPATSLATSAFVQNGLRAEAALRIAEIEYGESDVNTFDALARSGRIAASLSETTGGDLDRSRRHRELRGPTGLGDELRAVLMSEGTVWGGLTLGRASGREPFTTAEVALVASLSRHLAEGLRRAVLLTTPAAERHDHDEPAGVAVLAADNSIALADSTAESWLAELGATGPDAPLPPVVTAVASRARSSAQGRGPSSALARARVRTPSATWLTVRGSTLGDKEAQTAVTLEPTRPHELRPSSPMRTSSRAASVQSRSSSPRACPQTRSRVACTSRGGRSRTTSRPSSTRSARARAANSPPASSSTTTHSD